MGSVQLLRNALLPQLLHFELDSGLRDTRLDTAVAVSAITAVRASPRIRPALYLPLPHPVVVVYGHAERREGACSGKRSPAVCRVSITPTGVAPP
jgi:hypothetical protein